MKCNPDDPAVACVHVSQNNATGETTSYQTHGGLTKREEFAKAALHGLLVGVPTDGMRNPDPLRQVARAALRVADALIEELNK